MNIENEALGVLAYYLIQCRSRDIVSIYTVSARSKQEAMKVAEDRFRIGHDGVFGYISMEIFFTGSTRPERI